MGALVPTQKFFKAKSHIPADDKEQLSLKYPDGQTYPERLGSTSKHWANWSHQHTPNIGTEGDF